jgi:hypothetical protein
MTVAEIDPAELRHLYEERRLSLGSIAKLLGCSASTVMRAMTAAGLSRRPLSRKRGDLVCQCGAWRPSGKFRCADCLSAYWREHNRRRRPVAQPRAVLFEIRGMNAGGEAVTGFYGAGTIQKDIGPWVARLLERRSDVASVQVWSSIDAEIPVANPRRKLVETVTRERRAA